MTSPIQTLLNDLHLDAPARAPLTVPDNALYQQLVIPNDIVDSAIANFMNTLDDTASADIQALKTTTSAKINPNYHITMRYGKDMEPIIGGVPVKVYFAGVFYGRCTIYLAVVVVYQVPGEAQERCALHHITYLHQGVPVVAKAEMIERFGETYLGVVADLPVLVECVPVTYVIGAGRPARGKGGASKKK